MSLTRTHGPNTLDSCVKSYYSPIQDGSDRRSTANGEDCSATGESSSTAATRARLPRWLGWRASQRGTKTGTSAERSAPRAPRAPLIRAGSRDAARLHRAASKPIRVSRDPSGAVSRQQSRPKTLSDRPFLGSTRPRTSHRRSGRRASALDWHARCRHSRRPLRERPLVSPWTALGRALARPCPHVSTRSAKRHRLRAR
jgi:hypothetical protein